MLIATPRVIPEGFSFLEETEESGSPLGVQPFAEVTQHGEGA